jgi:hypothetical protein
MTPAYTIKGTKREHEKWAISPGSCPHEAQGVKHSRDAPEA